LAEDGFSGFHAADLESYNNEFNKWKECSDKEHKKSKLLRDLATIIQGYASRKFGSSIIIRDLYGNMPEGVRKKFMFDAYPLAGRTACGKVRAWTRQQPGMHNVEYVFESGDDNYGKLRDRLRKDGFPDPVRRPGKSSKAHPDRIPFIPLQASDLLSYYLFRPLRIIANTGDCDAIPEVISILNKCPGEPGILLPHNLQEMANLLCVSAGQFETAVEPFEKPGGWL